MPVVAARMSYLASLQDDWDGDGAAAVTSVALRQAKGLIERAQSLVPRGRPETSATPFDIVPVPSGGIVLKWRGESAELHLEVGPEAEFGYLLIVQGPEGEGYTEGENIDDGELRDLLVRVLNS
jgi:hypothetical protein